MNNNEALRREELRAFIQSRRARIHPQDVGLPVVGHRRVAGLRREEVAALAGVGLTWYTMFETGNAAGVSSDVVDRIAHALRLSPGESMHLKNLAMHVSDPAGSVSVDSAMLDALHHWIDAPAYVVTSTWDVLAWNKAFSHVWGIEEPGGPPFNMVVRQFCDDKMRNLHGEDWPAFARGLVAMFRHTWARHLGDDIYARLLDRLLQQAEFAALWEAQAVENALGHLTATIDSPAVGRFAYEVLNLRDPSKQEELQILVVQLPRGETAGQVRAHLRALAD